MNFFLISVSHEMKHENSLKNSGKIRGKIRDRNSKNLFGPNVLSENSRRLRLFSGSVRGVPEEPSPIFFSLVIR